MTSKTEIQRAWHLFHLGAFIDAESVLSCVPDQRRNGTCSPMDGTCAGAMRPCEVASDRGWRSHADEDLGRRRTSARECRPRVAGGIAQTLAQRDISLVASRAGICRELASLSMNQRHGLDPRRNSPKAIPYSAGTTHPLCAASRLEQSAIATILNPKQSLLLHTACSRTARERRSATSSRSMRTPSHHWSKRIGPWAACQPRGGGSGKGRMAS